MTKVTSRISTLDARKLLDTTCQRTAESPGRPRWAATVRAGRAGAKENWAFARCSLVLRPRNRRNGLLDAASAMGWSSCVQRLGHVSNPVPYESTTYLPLRSHLVDNAGPRLFALHSPCGSPRAPREQQSGDGRGRQGSEGNAKPFPLSELWAEGIANHHDPRHVMAW